MTVTSRQLDSEFKSALVHSELTDSFVVLLSIDTIALVYTWQLGLPDQCPFH